MNTNYTNEDRIAVGKRIRKRMIDCDIDETQLAKDVGVSQQMISAICKGKKNPSLPVLRAICRRLESRIDDFVH